MEAEDGKLRKTDVADTKLILNMLAEASTKDISQAVNPEGFEESKEVGSSIWQLKNKLINSSNSARTFF